MLGEIVAAKPDSLISVLRALGVSISSPSAAGEALETLRRSRSRQVAPAVSVLWDDGPDGIRLSVPAAVGERGFGATLTLESGETREWSPSARVILGERRGEAGRRVIVRLPVPSLPHGYHRLEIMLGGQAHETLLLRAPSQAYRHPERTRCWGLFAPLYALHSHDSDGLGSFRELGRLWEIGRRRGAEYLSTLPLLPAMPGEASPYSPLSRLFWNESYVHLPTSSPRTERLAQLIDYASVADKQLPGLSRAADQAWIERPEAFDAFTARFPQVADYARFRAAMARYGKSWRRWPTPLRDGRLSDASVDPTLIRTHLHAQMLAEEQLSTLGDTGAALLMDLPIGVHRDGYDTWRHPELFADPIDVGAPPDTAFPSGQNWSFPPIIPSRSRQDHHGYLRAVLRHHMRHASILRVDHVMGLHRQFWIPQGAPVSEGVYVRYPTDELFAILSIESHRAACELVGENLGIVPDSVTSRMDRHGLRGIHVDQLTPELSIRKRTVASMNTHDTETFAGVYGQKPAALAAALNRLMQSPAELVTVNVEDLWLETERQNVPGTTQDERPNWGRRLRYAMEDLEREIGPLLDSLKR